MEFSSITALLAPLGLIVIMYGMGLTLTTDDFKRVVLYPRAVVLGSFAQILLLPALGFACALVFGLTKEMAVGLILLAACAGGATSNMLSYLARGDTALSVTLTAISSCAIIVTLPFVVSVALSYFMGADSSVQLPVVKTIFSLLLVTVLPVVAGMITHARFGGFTARAEPVFQKISVAFVFFVVVATFLKNRDVADEYFIALGPVCYTLSLVAMATGYGLARLFRLNAKQRVSITIEIGVQNVVTAVFVATALLQSVAISVPAAMYALPMFFNACVYVMLSRHKLKESV